jgi:hypothetical protein
MSNLQFVCCIAWLVQSCAYQPLKQLDYQHKLFGKTVPRGQSWTAIWHELYSSKTRPLTISCCSRFNETQHAAQSKLVSSKIMRRLSYRISRSGPIQQDCSNSAVQDGIISMRQVLSCFFPRCVFSNASVDPMQLRLRGGGHAIFRSRDDRYVSMFHGCCIPLSVLILFAPLHESFVTDLLIFCVFKPLPSGSLLTQLSLIKCW